jgi:DUF438 domain-containing protein
MFRLKREEFKEFLKGTEEEEITTYGEESEGVLINLMSNVFKINIIIYEIRKDEVVSYEYNEKRSILSSRYSEANIYLLFYDNHYDLIEKNSNALSEYDDER